MNDKECDCAECQFTRMTGEEVKGEVKRAVNAIADALTAAKISGPCGAIAMAIMQKHMAENDGVMVMSEEEMNTFEMGLPMSMRPPDTTIN